MSIDTWLSRLTPKARTVVEKLLTKTVKGETDVQNRIRIALSYDPRVILWRNHTGSIKDQHGRFHRFGLCPGSSDLVGILTTPTHGGRFFALEIKCGRGRLTKEQERWLEMIRGRGGVAMVAYSVAEAIEGVEKEAAK